MARKTFAIRRRASITVFIVCSDWIVGPMQSLPSTADAAQAEQGSSRAISTDIVEKGSQRHQLSMTHIQLNPLHIVIGEIQNVVSTMRLQSRWASRQQLGTSTAAFRCRRRCAHISMHRHGRHCALWLHC